jgi:sRNA-binding carbon storage regulator CsrA
MPTQPVPIPADRLQSSAPPPPSSYIPPSFKTVTVQRRVGDGVIIGPITDPVAVVEIKRDSKGRLRISVSAHPDLLILRHELAVNPLAADAASEQEPGAQAPGTRRAEGGAA